MISEHDPGSAGPEPRPESAIPEKADELLEAARKRGRGLLDRQKHAALDELSSVAEVMKDAARRFEEKEEGAVGRTVRKAAEQLDRISAYLQDRDLADVLHQTESALRQRPAVCLGVAAALGFAVGRFLRAGSQKVARDVRAHRDGSEKGPA